jgi:predicted permease
MLGRAWRRLRALVRKNDVERELNEELRYHLDRQIEQNLASGMKPAEARFAALRTFDGVEQAKEACRDARGVRVADDLWQDLKYGARGLARKPGFTLVIVLALAIGIGANTAIFSVVSAVLIRPLPYREPDRIVRIWESNPQRNAPFFSVSTLNFEDWKTRSRSFELMAAYTRQQPFALSGGDEPVQVSASRCTSNLFPLLGADMAAGRGFVAAEDAAGEGAAVLVSYGLAERRFGGVDRAVGETLTLDGAPFTVVGVLPRGLVVPGNDAEIWAPFAGGPARTDRGNHSLRVLGRLAPNVSIDAARTELAGIAGQLEAEYPDSNIGWGVALKHMDDVVVDESFRRALLVLLGAVGFVLLIACANVANLLLARGTARAREIAVREAVGASRGRVVRQLLTESALLAGAGGGLGLVLAAWGVDVLVALDPGTIPRADEISLDARVLAFALGASALTCLLFGLVPALRAATVDLSATLQDASKGTVFAAPGRRLRRLLVGTEVALAVVLLAGAGLLVRSFLRLGSVDLGFSPDRVVLMPLTLPAAKFTSSESARAFFGRLVERVDSLPGVEGAGAASITPLAGGNTMTRFAVEGRPEEAADADSADYRLVSENYLTVLGMRALRGRVFAASDGVNAERVAVVNEAMALRVWPGGDSVGARVRLSGVEGPPFTVVGVVANVREVELESSGRPMIYVPYGQLPVSRSMTLVARTAGDEETLAAALRSEVRALDADVPAATAITMEDVVARSVAEPRFHTSLLGLLAAIALLLAVAGIYSLVAYTVVQRTHEIGIRIALGARPADVVKAVAADGLVPSAAGICVGLAAALAMGPVLSNLLFEVGPFDPPTLLTVALVLAVSAALASFIPARRALRVDPVVALRDE